MREDAEEDRAGRHECSDRLIDPDGCRPDCCDEEDSDAVAVRAIGIAVVVVELDEPVRRRESRQFRSRTSPSTIHDLR